MLEKREAENTLASFQINISKSNYLNLQELCRELRYKSERLSSYIFISAAKHKLLEVSRQVDGWLKENS